MKELFNQQELITCTDSCNEAPSLIDYQEYGLEGEWADKTIGKEIVFVLKGDIYISYGFFMNQLLPEGSILLLPPGCYFNARTEKGVSVLIMRIPEAIRFCNDLLLEDMIDKEELPEEGLGILKINSAVHSYLSILIDLIKDGVLCKHYCELKTKEFLHLLKVYYPQEELSLFFRPLLSNDAQFTEFVLGNYHRVKTVMQFASLCSCSLSNFDKKFRRAFGISAYQWMMKKRNERVYHEIKTTNKSFTQIAEEQGFLSNSQFTDYCKKHLGGAPGKIRQNRNTGIHKFVYSKEQL